VSGRAEALRLPQDVPDGGDRGVPDLAGLAGDVTAYARMHADALGTGEFDRRALACWGLVARGTAALPWVVEGISSAVSERISDAGGVLRWIGVPVDWTPWLRSVVDSLPDGEAGDVLLGVLELSSGPSASGPSAAPEAQLMGGAHLPFTEPIWYLNESFDRVAAAAQSWLTGLDGQREFSRVSEPLPVLLSRLEPWSMPSWKQLLVATTGPWTALFSQGSDLSTADVVAARLGCRSVRTNFRARIVRDGRTVSHGDCALWLSEPGRPGRVIQANFGSRWTWELTGEPQPFEDLAAYRARAIPDRFDLDRLNSYWVTSKVTAW
jgi:hypothetical protein